MGPSQTRSLRTSRPRCPPLRGPAPLDRASGARALLAVSREGLASLRPSLGRSSAQWRRGSRPPSQPIALGHIHFARGGLRPRGPAVQALAAGALPPILRLVVMGLLHRGLGTRSGPHHASVWAPGPAGAGRGRRPGGRRGHPQLRAWGGGRVAHCDLSLPTLSAACRHVSERSTKPYVFQAIHSAATDGAMRAAARRSLSGSLVTLP